MGAVTGSRANTGRGGAPRSGKLLVEAEVARGPASVVHAARLAGESGDPSASRLAVKAYDPALRVLTPDASRFESAIDPRLARVRRGDETGDLPRDRLHRVTDLVRGAPGVLATVGSLRGLVELWAEVSRALGAAHARGIAHGHVHPGHALVLAGANGAAPRPFVVDAGVVLTPQAARLHPESAALLAPEAIEELLADRPAPATRDADVYSTAASLLAALGARPAAASLEGLLEAKRRLRPPVIAAAAVGRALDGRALGAVLARALSPDRELRPHDGDELARELSALLELPGPPHPPLRTGDTK